MCKRWRTFQLQTRCIKRLVTQRKCCDDFNDADRKKPIQHPLKFKLNGRNYSWQLPETMKTEWYRMADPETMGMTDDNLLSYLQVSEV